MAPRRIPFNRHELAANLRQLPEWNRASPAPDVVHFADFALFADDVCLELSNRWRTWVPEGLDLLPYPNGPKTRTIAVARCPDLILLRAAAGRIMLTTDLRLTDRVHSYRLLKKPPSWSFKDPRASHKHWRLAARQEIRASHATAWRTDVAGYFASVDLQLLARQMHDWRCDLDAIVVIVNALREWAHVVPGLPIGPEVFSALGNAHLEPLDRALNGVGASYYRYMDDVIVVGQDLNVEALTALTDETLGELRLQRNESKTHFYSPENAPDAVDDLVLSYLAGGTTRADSGRLLEVLEQEAEESYPDPKRVRFVLGGLGQDPAAAAALCAHPELLNCDPLETCAYLAQHLRNERVRTCLMEAIAREGDTYVALRLHAARAATACAWGRSEGMALLSVATDPNEHPLVRAHAWHAVTRTPAWKANTAMEAADEERHPEVRRAIVLTLQCAVSSPSKRTFLEKAGRNPLVTYAARFAA